MFKVENDGKNIIIDGFYQLDIKIGQPGPLIFMSLPLKMLNFTKALIIAKLQYDLTEGKDFYSIIHMAEANIELKN